MGQGSNDAFQALKVYLAHLPKVASTIPGETLLLYLAVSEQAVSAVLVVERAKEQMLVYYVNHSLAEFTVNYPLIAVSYTHLTLPTKRIV